MRAQWRRKERKEGRTNEKRNSGRLGLRKKTQRKEKGRERVEKRDTVKKERGSRDGEMRRWMPTNT